MCSHNSTQKLINNTEWITNVNSFAVRPPSFCQFYRWPFLVILRCRNQANGDGGNIPIRCPTSAEGSKDGGRVAAPRPKVHEIKKTAKAFVPDNFFSAQCGFYRWSHEEVEYHKCSNREISGPNYKTLAYTYKNCNKLECSSLTYFLA